MSEELFAFARRFVDGEIDADQFANAYMARWKDERDAVNRIDDPPVLSGCLSSVFCVTDLYNPDLHREEYEFDETRLRREVQKLLEQVTP